MNRSATCGACYSDQREIAIVSGQRRYLEKAVLKFDYKELSLVLNALRERYLVIQSAPHLCVPLGLLTPFYEWTGMPYVYIGLKMYDLLAGWFVIAFAVGMFCCNC